MAGVNNCVVLVSKTLNSDCLSDPPRGLNSSDGKTK